jgi:hypothetical protein
VNRQYALQRNASNSAPRGDGPFGLSGVSNAMHFVEEISGGE